MKKLLLFTIVLLMFCSCTFRGNKPELINPENIPTSENIYIKETDDTIIKTESSETSNSKIYVALNDNAAVPDVIPEIIDGAYVYNSETIALTSLSLDIVPIEVKTGDIFLDLEVERLVNYFVSYDNQETFYHGAYVSFDGMVELNGKVSYSGSIMNGGTKFMISENSYNMMPTFLNIPEEKKHRYEVIDIFPDENMLEDILPDRVENPDGASNDYIIYSEEVTVVFDNLELSISYESGAPTVFAEIVSIGGKVYDIRK